MADYAVLWVNPTQLESSPHQPAGRGVTLDASMKHLIGNIREIGLQYPPLVRAIPGDKFQIVDGHRRVKALGELAHAKIPVMVTDAGPADKLFAGVAGNVQKITATQWVGVYLSGGMVPSGPNRNCIIRLETEMGRGFLEKLAEAGKSPQCWNLANRVLKYIGAGEDRRKEVLNYLLKINTRKISEWLSGEGSAEKLGKAISAGVEPTL